MTSSLTFPVALTAEAHGTAQHSSENHHDGLRAKQAYLNGLARFAVEQYLQCMGLLDPGGSNAGDNGSHQAPSLLRTSSDFFIEILSDSTAVSVAKLGQLECCVILPGERQIRIPPDAESDRIGYVVVQLDPSLQKAQIIGFSPSLAQPGQAFMVDQLKSLEALIHHLHQLGSPRAQPVPINLTHWFQNAFEQGWQIYSDFLRAPTLEPAMGFRSPRLTGRKPISLGEEADKSMNLVMTLVQKPDHRTRIEIQVIPADSEELPVGLSLSVLDQQGETFLETCLTHPSPTLSVQPFTGAASEQFILSVQLNGTEFTEYFIA